ncbi:MAG: hypothetical protein GX443_13365 [Deltaproteobacteria bacterium]|nr:hypothetical protein [Deltaproteobacteria bacterium]
MAHTQVENKGIEKCGQDLFNYAVDREDAKTFVMCLPPDSLADRGRVEYELQVLRIITVGWGIAYCLRNSPLKTPLSEFYWTAVRELSQSVSSAAGLMTGKDIDYFQTLKDRLDFYVAALNRQPGATEPAAVIGPEFAKVCGSGDDVYTVVSGSKMFAGVISRVEEYLTTLGLK